MPETNFFWDPLSDNILQERDETGVVTAEYTTEPGLYGDLVSQRRSGQSRFYHYDGLGSTLALTDATATVTDTNAYSAFGEVTEHTGTTTNPFQYVGQKGYYRDPGTGDYVIRQRQLTTGRARWLTTDPTWTEREIRNYVYAHSNPLFYVDPSGAIPIIVLPIPPILRILPIIPSLPPVSFCLKKVPPNDWRGPRCAAATHGHDYKEDNMGCQEGIANTENSICNICTGAEILSLFTKRLSGKGRNCRVFRGFCC